MRVVLIGYMGSGKTTIGRIVANYLKSHFYDLDELITIQEKQSVRKIFLEHGEDNFRSIEKNLLALFLKYKKEYVLSAGGGTPCYENNISIMKQFAKTIYLRLTPDIIFKRLFTQKDQRPIISHLSEEKLFEFISHHLRHRVAFYEKAHYTIDVYDKSIAEIALDIHDFLLSL